MTGRGASRVSETPGEGPGRPGPAGAPPGGPARWLRRGSAALAVAGAALLCGVLVGAADARLQRSRDERALDRAVRAVAAGRSAGDGARATAAADPGARAPDPSDPVVLGRIDVPRVGVSSIVREGDDEATLAVAVGHVRGTSRPGEAGNVVLAGHRDSFFRGLRRVRPGDGIWIRTPGDVLEYVVLSTEVVGAGETRVLARTTEDRLTLVTCFPFGFVGPAPKRFVVRAAPVERVVVEPPPAHERDLGDLDGPGRGAVAPAEAAAGAPRRLRTRS